KTGNPHQYLVDGPIYVGDAYWDDEWKTILVGTLGAGGRGIFALDVTNPQSPEVLFELNEEDYPELGYILGQPLIAPMKDGSWAAIFGNGYHYESSSTSQLFVVDLSNPALTRVLDTG